MTRAFRSEIRLFISILVFVNLILAIWSVPVTDLSDESSYIMLSKAILGSEHANLAHRSPLYSIVVAGLMLVIQPPFLFKAVVFLQYAMVGIIAWLIFKIFRPLFAGNIPAMLIAILFNLSLSTLYYANIILTEILTAFLLVLSVYFLLQSSRQLTYKNLGLTGFMLGLLALARFNTIPIVVTFFLLLVYLLVKEKVSLLNSVKSFLVFSAPLFILVNLWCTYNYVNNGFYGLFPGSYRGVPRNAVVASIRPGNEVSPENEPILRIFLKAAERNLETTPPGRKGSLAGVDKFKVLNDLYSGYQIYNFANNDLKAYFGLDAETGEYEMNSLLNAFYKEIMNQNKAFITKMRFVSFLSGFRAATSDLPAGYGRINTNILPSWVFVVYKITMLFISVSVFFSVFLFVMKIIMRRWKINFTLLVFYAVVFSFWFINFYFVTVNDANRFKFPAEPFIIGLFVTQIYSIIKTRSQKNIATSNRL